jgi:bifunctional non-homologous end joining protein LigD
MHGITVSHPERVIDASTGLTKLDLVRYYETVANWMLPHLQGRPCSLLRGPSGISGQLFFQRHAGNAKIPGVVQLDPRLWPGHGALLEIRSTQGLVSAAQMNTIELHTWNATTKHINRPDRIVFDLDPGEDVAWSAVQESSELARAFLTEVGLRSWLKTSGGKGLHVIVPLAPHHTWETVKRFSKQVVQHLARVIPDRFAAKSGASNRVGRIFVDYLRNGQGATTVAAFSARARAGLGVSMPVHWEELPDLKSGAQWTIATAREHLSPHKADPWSGYRKARQSLDRAMQKLGVARERVP